MKKPKVGEIGALRMKRCVSMKCLLQGEPLAAGNDE